MFRPDVMKNYPITPIGVASLTVLLATNASAQDAPSIPSAPSGDPEQDIVVVGIRGSAIGNIAPIAELDAAAIDAIGAQSLEELNRAIQGQTHSAAGSDPIRRVNA